MNDYGNIGRAMQRLLSLVATLGFCHVARAQTATCEALPAPQKALARELFAALHPYDGCDATFALCLATKTPPGSCSAWPTTFVGK